MSRARSANPRRAVGRCAIGLWSVCVAFGCAHPSGSTPSAGSSAAPPPPGAATSQETAASGQGAAVATDLSYWRNRADLIRAPAPPEPAELALPAVERWRLPSGLEVLAVPRKGLPIVSFSVAVKAGAYDEQKGENLGVAQFVAAMLRKGTKKRTADQISDAIDFVGGALDSSAGGESSNASCTALAKDAQLCLDLLSDILVRPTFPEPEIPEVRDQLLAALASRYDDPHRLAAEHFDNLLFGESHPDGWVLNPRDVEALRREHLVAFWRTYYRPRNAILAIAGDVDVPVMKRAVAKAFAGWTDAPVPARRPFAIPEARGTRVLVVNKPDLTQATLMFGHPGIRHADPDFYAVTLVNYALGGSDFSSRLMAEVRARRGLTYGIGSSFGAPLYQGAFRVSASSRTETAWSAFTVAVDELKKMKVSGPTPEELAKAKGYYAGSYPFGLQSAARVAGSLVAAELHGLDSGYVRQLPIRLAAVDVAAARAAAAARLKPDGLTVVIVGRADAIIGEIRKAKLPFEQIDYRDPISAADRQSQKRGAAHAP